MKSLFNFSIIAITIFFSSCGEDKESLKIYGPAEVNEDGDTTHYTIPEFSFINQYGEEVNNATVKDKIYVADFFFTTCQTICPKMNANLSQVYDHFDGNDKVRFLSHSLDPEKDTQETLLAYAEGLEATNGQWDFVRGSEEDIYRLAEKDGYFTTAKRDESVIDGINHSGVVVLVDGKGRIRGFYKFVSNENIDQLIGDIETLIHEEG